MADTDTDLGFMSRALDLAARGEGTAEPNPLVGCVVTRDGQVVGEGWHERYGQAHAEINALRDAGVQAAGGTLYVTLEPCCHHGQTPPCTQAVRAAGITRAVIAQHDPFPQVNRQGIAELEAAGITVEVGLLAAQARHLNAPYIKRLTTGRTVDSCQVGYESGWEDRHAHRPESMDFWTRIAAAGAPPAGTHGRHRRGAENCHDR